MSEIHNITSVGKNEEPTVEMDENKITINKDGIEEVLESAKGILVKPFWKSTIIRAGIVIVAVTAVKTAGRVIIARNNAKFGV